MKYTVEGIKTRLIEIDEYDSADIIAFRNNPSLNKYLSSSSEITLDMQTNWIKKNAEQMDNVYFKITDLQNCFFGTIALYNISNGKAEFGRYICTNSILAIESEYLLLKFGFSDLKLNLIYCKTVSENKKVSNQHKKLGFETIGIEMNNQLKKELNVQQLTKDNFFKFDYGFIMELINHF